jgi:hypothetical protein
VIIQGRFIGDAPYFSANLRSVNFEGFVWLMADTGSSRTTLLDRDVKLLKIPSSEMIPASLPIVGIGGSVRSFYIKNVSLTLMADEEEVVLSQDIFVVQHDLERIPPEEVSRILRLPSVMGRYIISQFHLRYNYHYGIVLLEK